MVPHIFEHAESENDQLHDVILEGWKSIPVATREALVNSIPRRVKADLDNNGGHTKYWRLTCCMLILPTFTKGCTHFCCQGFSFQWLYLGLFWGENKLTLLYKLHTDYFSLCQSVILSVLSHKKIYLNICRNVRGVLTFVIHCMCVHVWVCPCVPMSFCLLCLFLYIA